MIYTMYMKRTLTILFIVLSFFAMPTSKALADTSSNRDRVNTIKNGDVFYLGRNTTATQSGSRNSTSSATSKTTNKPTKLHLLSKVNIEIPQGFAEDIGSVINAILSVVMLLAALLVFMQLILGGIFWITAGGDKGKTEAARQRITSALLGLVVLSATYAIFNLALNFLGFASLDEVLKNTRTITGK